VNAALLEARGLQVAFPGRGREARAVDTVNLALRPGEILALVGESGCGKTTLARTLLGLQRPTSGSVRYAGAELEYSTAKLRRYRREVQMILQDPTGALNPRQTVYESVAEGLRIHRVVERSDGSSSESQRVAEALARAGMRPPERFFLSYPHELSGGQRQRVVIAGALALEPKVLVADEPVSSLDASIRGEILALLLRLRDEMGLAVLVITHDLGLAWNIADRIAVMYLGRIVEVGPTETVLDRPQHPYTRALLSVVPEIKQIEPVVLAGEPPDPARIPAGCRFHPRCPAYNGGRAAEAGVADDCRSTPLPVLPASAADDRAAQPHLVACWLAAHESSAAVPGVGSWESVTD
jgi:oligopeptide/dipeptide ABC transporter ATP-binding protein